MFQTPDYHIGDYLTIQKRVLDEDAALTYGSGQLVSLLATPSLVALMIDASCKLLEPKLPSGFITVGRQVEVLHSKPSEVGHTVSLRVTIREIQGTHIFLDMEAFDENGLIGTGSHERVIVNKDALLKRAADTEQK